MRPCATYQIAPLLFAELGAKAHVIGATPDGLNINDAVGSTHPQALQKAVVEQGADLGIAFDGDGDRVLMVDDRGALVDGDGLLYVLAHAWKASGRLRGPVVGTVMTNYGFEQAMERAGIAFVRAKVGDRHVHQALVEGGGVLGGEASGHLLCLDRATTGDAIISALQVLEVLKEQGKTLRQAIDGLVMLPQTTINVRLSGDAKAVVSAPAVLAALEQAQAAVAGRGRAFLRPSGTEPVVRVTVEADEEGLVQSTVQALAAAVQAAAA